MAIRLKQRGQRRLRGPRARRRRRRHLARQHLPGLRLRRPVAPLLLLVRAQPGLDARPSRRSREIRAYLRSVRRRVRHAPAHPLRLRGRVGAPGTRTRGRWQLETADGAVAARVLVAGDGAADRAAASRTSRASTASRATIFHSAALGPRLRPDRQARRRRSAPAPRRSSSCPRSSREVAQLHVFQRTPPWIMPALEPADHRAASAGSTAAFPALQRLVRGGVYAGARAARARLRQAARG